MDPDNTCCAALANTKSRCFFCRGSHHDRSVCAARNATCFKCKKEGHSLKMRHSNPKITSAATCPNRLATMLIKYYICLLRIPKQATLYVLVGKNGTSMALINMRSSGSFISYGYGKKNRQQMKPATGNVSIASSSLNASIKGLYSQHKPSR